MKAKVTFSVYYDYEVEVDKDLWDEDPEAAIDEAIDKAKNRLFATQREPIAHCGYDECDFEIYDDEGNCIA